MRIVGGTYRGRRLFVPTGLDIRPTADRVKEAIFNILGARVRGAGVLDLFAGTGALGLEALSRGADRVVLADQSPKSLAAAKRNIEALGVTEIRLLKLFLPRELVRLRGEEPFDLLFLDPPYGRDLAVDSMNLAGRLGLVRVGGWAVVELGAKEDLNNLDPDWSVVSRRTYGQTAVSFMSFEKKSSGGPPVPLVEIGGEQLNE